MPNVSLVSNNFQGQLKHCKRTLGGESTPWIFLDGACSQGPGRLNCVIPGRVGFGLLGNVETNS